MAAALSVSLLLPAQTSGAVSAPAVDPVQCLVPEGTATLPDNCTDPGDRITSETVATDLTVPVPADGEWVFAEAIMDDGQGLSLRAEADEEGEVSTVVQRHSDDSGERSTSAPAECSDSWFRLLPFTYADGTVKNAKWYAPLTWRFKTGTSPSGLAESSVVKFLQQSLVNIATGRNSCGLPDQISASGSYAGTTNASLSPYSGGCTQSDGLDVVAFKDLGGNRYLGLTCAFGTTHAGYDQITSADVALDRSGRNWYLPGTRCTNSAWNVEGIATHEFGHAFGLDDVAEAAHGNLTMSGTNNGACQASEITLGRGDVRGLEQLY